MTSVQWLGMQPGETPCVRVTYRFGSLDEATKKLDEAMALHGPLDIEWSPEALELVLVFR